MALYLVPTEEGRPIVIDKAVLFVGRHPDCDVILTRSRKVSRKHCCLAQVDNRFVIRDLGSMNGIQVNGQRVQHAAPVTVGDEIVIGDVHFVLQADKRRRAADGEPEAAADSAMPRQLPPVPDDLSQEFPVAIPDEAASFKLEGTMRPGTSSVPPRRVDEPQDDVVPLEDSAHGTFDDDGSLPDV